MFGFLNYGAVVILFMTGLYIIMSHGNLIKKMIGLNIFQSAVILLYVSAGKITEGTAPILDDRFEVYSNPLPHVLMLTAIVVGLATTAVGMALIVRIQEHYGTIEDEEIQAKERVE